MGKDKDKDTFTIHKLITCLPDPKPHRANVKELLIGRHTLYRVDQTENRTLREREFTLDIRNVDLMREGTGFVTYGLNEGYITPGTGLYACYGLGRKDTQFGLVDARSDNPNEIQIIPESSGYIPDGGMNALLRRLLLDNRVKRIVGKQLSEEVLHKAIINRAKTGESILYGANEADLTDLFWGHVLKSPNEGQAGWINTILAETQQKWAGASTGWLDEIVGFFFYGGAASLAHPLHHKNPELFQYPQNQSFDNVGQFADALGWFPPAPPRTQNIVVVDHGNGWKKVLSDKSHYLVESLSAPKDVRPDLEDLALNGRSAYVEYLDGNTEISFGHVFGSSAGMSQFAQAQVNYDKASQLVRAVLSAIDPEKLV